MDQTKTSTETNENQISQDTNAGKHGASRWRGFVAIVGALVAIVGWCMFFFSPAGGAGISVAALVMSVFGLWSGRGCLRDIAIAAVIASVVLIVVYVLFAWGVPYAVDRL